MRILMVSSLWPPAVLGGAERYAAALVERLRAAGHEVGVVTSVDGADEHVVARIPSWGYEMTEYASQPAVRRVVFHAGDLIRPDAARTMDRAIRDFRPDVVHSHVVQGMGATALTRPGHDGVAHVHTLHDYWLLCQRTTLVQRDGTACVTRCASCRVVSGVRDAAVRRHPPDVVLAVSQAIARIHADALAWVRGRVRVVPNPVTEFPGPPRRRPTPGPVTFGFVGQVSRTKGILTLVEAVRAGRDRGCPARRRWTRPRPRCGGGRGSARRGPGLARRRRARGSVRRDRLPGGPVGVGGPRAPRAQRGACPRDPGHRRAHRRHSGAGRAAVRGAPLPVGRCGRAGGPSAALRRRSGPVRAGPFGGTGRLARAPGRRAGGLRGRRRRHGAWRGLTRARVPLVNGRGSFHAEPRRHPGGNARRVTAPPLRQPVDPARDRCRARARCGPALRVRVRPVGRRGAVGQHRPPPARRRPGRAAATTARHRCTTCCSTSGCACSAPATPRCGRCRASSARSR